MVESGKGNVMSEDFVRIHEENINENICILMKRQKISNIMLSRMTGINVSSLSKILNGKVKLSVENLCLIAKALEVEPATLLSTEVIAEENNNQSGLFNSFAFEKNGAIIRDPNHFAFKGYLGEVYYVYFYSTISTEGNILEGTLQFKASGNNKVCLSEMELKIGKQDKEGNEIVKKYRGELLISLPMNCCYCILVNSDMGEVSFLNFRHMFLFNNTLVCRMAGALTTSSGESKLPTMHRALISAKRLEYRDNNMMDLGYIQGQLCLNNSNIIIKKNILEELCRDEVLDDSRKSTVDILNEEMKNAIRHIINAGTFEECYKINEASIRAETISSTDKIELFNILRTFSEASKYNKISPKSDEYTFNKIQQFQ